jgi:uncharacterized linocin/CFP29 family protein
MARRNGTAVHTGRAFFKGSSGKWAGEQMLNALQTKKPISPAILRDNGVLLHEEWKYFDTAVQMEALIQLRGVAALEGAGCTINVPNAMGKTVYAYEKATDMDDATVSMDPVTRSENDRTEFDLAQMPLPVTHKDFYINIRTLMASRERGEPLDTTQIRIAGRKVSEKTEKMLFQGLTGKFGGLSIYGLTTEPNRNLNSFGTNGNWATTNVAKTGNNVLDDVLSMMSLAESVRYYGPFGLFVPRNSNVKLDNDFKANSDLTIRQRLLEIDGLSGIWGVDQLPSNNVVLVQMTPDVVAMVNGEGLQTVQWDVEGGMRINFKAFQIKVPLVRSDIQGRSGVVHTS